MIGDDVEITIVDIRGDKVRLGISAPSRITVHRKEVYAAISKENEHAARIDRNDISELVRSLGTNPRKKDLPAAGIVSTTTVRDLRSTA